MFEILGLTVKIGSFALRFLRAFSMEIFTKNFTEGDIV